MSEDKTMTHRDEMETLLPFYLNGTLSGADLASVEDWLANDPNAEAALADAESELAFISEDNERLRPDSQSFRRFSESLEKEAAPRVSAASWLSALLAKTFTIPAPLVWASAAAALVLMVVASNNLSRNTPNDIEVAGAGQSANAAFVLVTFKPDAKLADVATLLQASGGQITEGPNSGGTFKIMLPVTSVTDYDRIVGEFAKSPLVDQVIPGRKPDAAN